MKQLILFIGLVIYSVQGAAQEDRSLIINLGLDVPSIDRDLDLEITVSNHSFVVVSIFPFVSIRPITSQQRVFTRLTAGQSEVLTTVQQILLDTVSYVVEINCLGCTDTVPRQFYRTEGNTTASVNSTFINPEDLPEQITTRLITRAQISGQLSLLPDQISERNLVFEVSATDVVTGTIVGSQIFNLGAGESSVNYFLRGITRRPTDEIEVVVRCRQCIGVLPNIQTFDQTFSTQEDVFAVDFVFDAQAGFLINGVLDLILDTD